MRVNEKLLEYKMRSRFGIAYTSKFTIAKDIIDLKLFLFQQKIVKSSRKKLEKLIISNFPNIWIAVEIETEPAQMRNDPTPVIVFYKLDLIERTFARLLEIRERTFKASFI